MSTGLRVFTSSTFRDMQPERAAVRDAVESLAAAGRTIRWVGMEDFGALATSALLASEEFAEQADIVVLLLGGRYGSYAPEEPVSFTHAEWAVVRRDRIPCLVYLKQVDEGALGNEIADLRRQVREELVCATYIDVADLSTKVRLDLERELRTIPIDRSALALSTSPPPIGGIRFAGRDRELATLTNALREREARVGVWGQPGIGKTSFVRHFFAVEQEGLLEPLWLRVDDLFATDAAGRRRIEALRWDRSALLERLKSLQDAHPRAVFVFDNVQAAPLLVRWLAARMSGNPCVFVAWDAQALPSCHPVIALHPLAREESCRVFDAEVEAHRGDKRAVDRLCALLGDYPLLLDFAVRRFALDPVLTLDELSADLERPADRLMLHGPTIDQPDVHVRRMFVSSYLRLAASERQALSALVASASNDISAQTMAWAVSTFSNGEFRRMDRAMALGFIDGRPFPDWRGHRYALRAIVSDFLRTTEGFARAVEHFNEYLASRESLDDDSIDVLATALKSQLDAARPAVPWDGDWLEPLLFERRPQVRARIAELLGDVRDADQVHALAQSVISLLSTPRLEEPTLISLRLLTRWKDSTTEPGLLRIWRRPVVCDEAGERLRLRNIATEAGRALAALRGQSFGEFLRAGIRSPEAGMHEPALSVAGESRELTVVDELIAMLDHRSPRMRRAAIDALVDYDPDERYLDEVWRVYQKELDEGVRRRARWGLGVWKDARVFPELLLDLDHPDGDVRAEAISVLWHFPRVEVADRLAALLDSDPDPDVRTNAAFVLSDFLDPRAAHVALRQISSADPATQRLGMFSISRVKDSPLTPATREALRVRISQTLAAAPEVETRLVARAALLDLEDARACEGLWSDLALEESRQHPEVRQHAVFALARWRPTVLDPEPLRALLHDSDPLMRGIACLVAGQAQAVTLIRDLQSLASDASTLAPVFDSVGQLASEALDRIAGRRPPWEPHPRVRPTHASTRTTVR